ncbi:hypothetical protein [Burkholderia glumae]|uniref:hypothetical protein n=1 Tax=Burkholderia glumae TaxID=337 RepID=UPI002150D242|nr:hypothetical protein [Burkholderia glumae]
MVARATENGSPLTPFARKVTERPCADTAQAGACEKAGATKAALPTSTPATAAMRAALARVAAARRRDSGMAGTGGLGSPRPLASRCRSSRRRAAAPRKVMAAMADFMSFMVISVDY